MLAGSPYSADDVSAVSVRAQEGDFNYEHRAPGQFGARYTQDLRANDILRDDDLVDASAQVEIAVTAAGSAPAQRRGIASTCSPPSPAAARRASGRRSRSSRASGGALTILVPVDQEEAWISVASSSIALHAARSAQLDPASLQPLKPDDAVSRLCGSSCSGVPGSTATTP